MTQNNKRTLRVGIRMRPDEHERFRELSDETQLSVSELVRRIVMMRRVPSRVDHDAVRSLCQINGDLARLGNLLKLAIDNNNGKKKDINDLLKELTATQAELKRHIADIGLK